MPIVNLKKFYYHEFREDTFVEVSDEVAEALLDLHRAEDRLLRKIRYHKAYYSLDVDYGIENTVPEWRQPSPEDLIIEQEDLEYQELLLERLKEAVSALTPKQAKRIHARYMDGKKLKAIAAEEGISVNCVSKSLVDAEKRLKKYFDKQNWKRREED